MAIVIFVTHGRQEYCLTKHLVIIFNTGFCITLILAALTPCARRPGNGVDRGRYGGRLLQAGCVVVYITYWTWSAMQSSPERPGIVEMSTFLMAEDDLTCQVCNNLQISQTQSRPLLSMLFFKGTRHIFSRGWALRRGVPNDVHHRCLHRVGYERRARSG